MPLGAAMLCGVVLAQQKESTAMKSDKLQERGEKVRDLVYS